MIVKSRYLAPVAVAMLAACQPSGPVVARTYPSVVELRLDPDGAVYLDGNRMAQDELRVAFKAMAAQEPNPEIRLAADVGVKYKVVMDVLAAVHSAGLESRLVVVGEN